MKILIDLSIDRLSIKVHETDEKTQSLKFYYRKQEQLRKENINENDELLKFI